MSMSSKDYLKVKNEKGEDIGEIEGFSYTLCTNLEKRGESYAGSIICSPNAVRKLMNDVTDIVVTVSLTDGSYVCKVTNFRILNIGSGVSFDDTSLETQITYVADKITPWELVSNNNDK